MDGATDHYLTLGLHRRCTQEQIRTAYRVLAKRHHPDVNGGSAEAVAKTQALTAAYAVLGDPEQRAAYDRELAAVAASERDAAADRGGRRSPPRSTSRLSQDVTVRLEDFLRGARLEVRVKDPSNEAGAEVYDLELPAGTAPGTRFRVERSANPGGGVVDVRVRAAADFRFKVRGSDLRCDLRISTARAAGGGSELVRGLTGMVRVEIPRRVERGAVVRVSGEGLPRSRGGRGDLLVRIQYRPEVRVRRVGS